MNPKPRFHLPKRKREERGVGSAVLDALEFRGITESIRGQRIAAEWVELVGAKIAQRTRPGDIRERVLYVDVATSAWMHELSLLKPQLLASLLTRLGEPKLFDDIKLKLAGRSRPQTELPATGRRRMAPPRPYVPPASGAAREQILRETEAVDDVELRALIARVRIANDR